MLTLWLVLLLNSYFVVSSPFLGLLRNSRAATCQIGCHELVDGKINVHLVPHSHDDVGWLKTYDEYYVGTGNFGSIQNAGVSYILNSTIKALNESTDRRFIQVETAFFYKWWNEQNQETRDFVVELVNSGRLEMINGAWSMNDEADAHYQSIIDQFTWGFRILEDTVGECGRPKIGWQIDPFGHSREHASISKQLGFEGLVVGRIDYRDKAKRIEDKNLDFMWNTNDNFAESDAEIFTTMFPDFYVYESGFCFDSYCSDGEITDVNLATKVSAFKTILNKYKDYFQTKNIMMPMGHDFAYQEAEKNFGSIDKLIEGFADDDTYNVIYSTPSCYIRAVKDEVAKNNIVLTVKTDDFFPYASDAHSFWTGYFTSRPTSKRFERDGNNILQSAKQLTTFSRIKGNDDDVNINKLRMAMGVMQHHDAITGTEKQAVTNDYSHLMDDAIKGTEESVGNIITGLLKKTEDVTIDLNLSYCLLSNISICNNSRNSNNFIIAVQNPLSKTVSHYVKLPVDGANYKITGPKEDGNIVFDIFDSISTFTFISDGEKATKELVFLAKDLPPLGIKLYYVEKIEEAGEAYFPFVNVTQNDQRTFGDEINGFTISTSGKLATVTINEQTLNIVQDFYYYKGSISGRASGAYVFRPDGTEMLITDILPTIKFARGNLVDEVYQIFNEEVTQIIRLYKGDANTYIEFDWLVGDLRIDTDNKGKEIITRFVVDSFNNNDVFYTDANSRQQIKRIRNHRNDYEYNSTEEPASSNYYPVTSKIVMIDETQQLELAVLNDRPQGGSSLTNGALELMVHRRDTKDDGFGVGEALNETQYSKGLYARGQHYLTFAKIEDGKPSPAVFERDLAHRKLLAPLVLVGAVTDDLATVQKAVNFKFEALSRSLPNNVKLLTLEPWKDSYLLRLEHIFEKGEDATLSADVDVDLTDLFVLFNITELTAVSLGANENIATEKESSFSRLINPWAKAAPELTVTLKPMDIKTFIFKTDQNNNGGNDNGIVTPPGPSSAVQNLNSISVLIVLITSYLFF